MDVLKQANLLSRNGQLYFKELAHKRNYLAHSLFDLFSRETEETLLPRQDLVEEDIEVFRERVEELAEEFQHSVGMVRQSEVREGLLL